MKVQYIFKGVIRETGSEVFAEFEKGTFRKWPFNWLMSGLANSRTVAENEKGCKSLYLEATTPENVRGPFFAGPETADHARQAWNAIRNFKQQNGLPLDTQNIDR